MQIDQKKLTVMQILPSLQSGGVERGVIDIAKALKKDNFEPIVMSSGGVLVYQLKEAGIKHIELPVNSKNPLVIFRNIQKIITIIKQHNVDIVHVRSRAPMWSAYFACKKTHTKLVATIHGTYSLKFWRFKNFAPKRFYNSIMLKADKIIVVSNFIKEYLVENYREKDQEFSQTTLDKVSVIQRGVDLKYFDIEKVSKNRIIDLMKKWHLPEDKKIIMLPARFTEWKGHEFLIQALSEAKSNFYCILVGSDHGHKKFRKKIENKIVKSGLEGRVKIVGICKDMPAAYAISNLVICSSVKPEAFGRVAIEAQAISKIIIATKIGGALETIIDAVTGFLIEPWNVKQLAESIDNVLGLSHEESEKICLAAKKHVEENFSNEKMCQETIKVYHSLVV